MSGRDFVDTNILVYAHDGAAGSKYEIAGEVLKEAWNKRSGVISTQVLQEFYVTVTGKVEPKLDPEHAIRLVRRYTLWRVVDNDVSAVIRAAELQKTFQLSFWDALIVNAALRAKCSRLISEDLNHGQSFEDLVVVNPFVDSTE